MCVCSVGEGKVPAPWRHVDLPTPPRTPPYTHTHMYTHTHVCAHTHTACPSFLCLVPPLTHTHSHTHTPACPSFLCLVVLHSDWRGGANSCGRDSPTLQLHPGAQACFRSGGWLLGLSLLYVLAWLSGRESLKARERSLFRRWFLWPRRSRPPRSSRGVAGGWVRGRLGDSRPPPASTGETKGMPLGEPLSLTAGPGAGEGNGGGSSSPSGCWVKVKGSRGARVSHSRSGRGRELRKPAEER